MAAIVPTKMKILTMVMRNQLRDAVFLLNKQSPTIILLSMFFQFHIAIYRSVGPIYKNTIMMNPALTRE